VCGRSEGSDGHMPLPKERPAPPKTDPPRRCGRSGPQPRSRASEHARGRRWRHRRHGPAAARSRPATHAEPTPTEPIEPDDSRPRLPPLSYSQLLPAPTPACLHVASIAHPPALTTTPTTHHTLPPPHCRRPAPGPQHPHGLARPGLPGGSRKGASATRWPPFLERPGVKRKTGRRRGGGPFALKTNP
jgi:hypothetical protein